VFLTFLALVRYGDVVGISSLDIALIYTRDTVFPVGSLAGILNSPQVSFVGFEYFFNQFYAVIPRFMWVDKPIYLDTIGYFLLSKLLDMVRV